MSDLFDYINRDVELFFGLVGPIGTNLDFVVEELSRNLKVFNYNSKEIGVIKTLGSFSDFKDVHLGKNYEGRLKKMEAGNEYRKRTNRKDALALLALGQIREERTIYHKEKKGNGEEGFEDSNIPIPRKAYIIKSLKTPEEVELLREIYEENFYVISVSSKTSHRKKYLQQKLNLEGGTFHPEDYDPQVIDLIKRDEEEEENQFGQNITDTFPLADIFIDVDNIDSTKKSIQRFIELIFGFSIHTPNQKEYAMYHAKAASLRSAALGRQVGAALVDSEGEVIAVGTNEVPKAGGGQYWPDADPDHRDHKNGADISDQLRKQTILELIDKVRSIPEFAFQKEYKKDEIDGLVEKYLFTQKESPLRKAQVMNLVEFGRTVHAEMASIMDAARRGISVKDCELFVTTFPCHECSRHIISAGIKKVTYIEPYPKSLVITLHGEAVEVEQLNHKVENKEKVEYVPFIGVAPRQFNFLFEMTKRKDEKGNLIIHEADKLNPRQAETHTSYINKEVLAFRILNEINYKNNIN